MFQLIYQIVKWVEFYKLVSEWESVSMIYWGSGDHSDLNTFCPATQGEFWFQALSSPKSSEEKESRKGMTLKIEAKQMDEKEELDKEDRLLNKSKRLCNTSSRKFKSNTAHSNKMLESIYEINKGKGNK